MEYYQIIPNLYQKNTINIYNSTHEIRKKFKINHIIKLDNMYFLINEKNNLILLSPTYFEIYK